MGVRGLFVLGLGSRWRPSCATGPAGRRDGGRRRLRPGHLLWASPATLLWRERLRARGLVGVPLVLVSTTLALAVGAA